MFVDGKKIAASIRDAVVRDVRESKREFKLAIVLVGEHPASRAYTAMKQKYGESIGIATELVQLPTTIREVELVEKIKALCRRADITGLIVQLPLPAHFDKETTERVLDAVPVGKDVDVLSRRAQELFAAGRLPAMPGVAGAVNAILEHYRDILADGGVVLGKDTKAVVLGKGALVGKPAAELLRLRDIEPILIDSQTSEAEKFAHLRRADLVVSGMGRPHSIVPDMLKEGAVLIDAGTSGIEGALRGDAHPDCAAKCLLFTPVPGGVGPITVAMIFKNLLVLKDY